MANLMTITMGESIADFSVIVNGTPVEYIQNIVFNVELSGGKQTITAIFPNVQVAPVLLQQAILQNVALLQLFPYVTIIYEAASVFTVGP